MRGFYLSLLNLGYLPILEKQQTSSVGLPPVQFIHITVKENRTMKIISTECSEEQQKEDMPELLKMNAEAKKTEIMWGFFGGTITLSNGNQYQVLGD